MFEIVVSRQDLLLHLANLFERSKDETAFKLLSGWFDFIKHNRIIQTVPFDEQRPPQCTDSSWDAAVRLTAQSANNFTLKNINKLSASAFRVYVENENHNATFKQLSSIAQVHIRNTEMETFFKRCLVSKIPRTKLFGHGFTQNSTELSWFDHFRNQSKEAFLYDRFLAGNLSSISSNLKSILISLNEAEISNLRISVAFCRQNSISPWTERELNPIAAAFTDIGISKNKLHILPLVSVPHHDRVLYTNLNVVHSGDSFYYFNQPGTNESKGTRVSVNSVLEGNEATDGLKIMAKIYETFEGRVGITDIEKESAKGFKESWFYQSVKNKDSLPNMLLN